MSLSSEEKENWLRLATGADYESNQIAREMLKEHNGELQNELVFIALTSPNSMYREDFWLSHIEVDHPIKIRRNNILSRYFEIPHWENEPAIDLYRNFCKLLTGIFDHEYWLELANSSNPNLRLAALEIADIYKEKLQKELLFWGQQSDWTFEFLYELNELIQREEQDLISIPIKFTNPILPQKIPVFNKTKSYQALTSIKNKELLRLFIYMCPFEMEYNPTKELTTIQDFSFVFMAQAPALAYRYLGLKYFEANPKLAETQTYDAIKEDIKTFCHAVLQIAAPPAATSITEQEAEHQLFEYFELAPKNSFDSSKKSTAKQVEKWLKKLHYKNIAKSLILTENASNNYRAFRMLKRGVGMDGYEALRMMQPKIIPCDRISSSNIHNSSSKHSYNEKYIFEIANIRIEYEQWIDDMHYEVDQYIDRKVYILKGEQEVLKAKYTKRLSAPYYKNSTDITRRQDVRATVWRDYDNFMSTLLKLIAPYEKNWWKL